MPGCTDDDVIGTNSSTASAKGRVEHHQLRRRLGLVFRVQLDLPVEMCYISRNKPHTNSKLKLQFLVVK